ncbi:MAG: carboxypeptidase-like regulatory domain-containing protein [Thermoplasmata archaeon]
MNSLEDGVRRRQLRRAGVILVLLVFLASALVVTTAVPPPARASSPAPLATAFSDDFTQDTALNPALWQVNGSAGAAFAMVNCPACANITLQPSFSRATGMEIAQADGDSVVGTIQSVPSFAPPFTATAFVTGTVANGHTFVFGITTAIASSGVQITGNLNPRDCSNETDCGNHATCGNPANASVSPNECFYGIYARASTGGGTWPRVTPFLNLSPSVNLVYTLQIAVDSSGNAQYEVSAGGQLLGQATDQVGTGPFYLIIAQSEGSPVQGPGPNVAYWTSASLTPTAPTVGNSPSGGSGSGLTSIEWLLIVLVVAVALILLVVLRSRRGRELTVSVLDSGTLSPIPGANVSVDGPKSFSGSTGTNGRVAFGGVRAGDYAVRAGAPGYASPPPVTIPVRRVTAHTVRLNSITSPAPVAVVSPTPVAGPTRPSQEPARGFVPRPPPTPAPAVAPSVPPPPPAAPSALGEEEGFGGGRIREIIRTFQAKGALSPETALTAQELGLSRIFVRIMKRRRGRTMVFVEVNGKYYLDEQALRAMK